MSLSELDEIENNFESEMYKMENLVTRMKYFALENNIELNVSRINNIVREVLGDVKSQINELRLQAIRKGK